MAGIGNMEQIKLEKWAQVKNASGSLVDTRLNSYPIWADIRKRGGARSYENHQTKLSDSLEVRIYWKANFDITATWKVVYDGRRHTVRDIEKVNEERFNFILLIESK